MITRLRRIDSEANEDSEKAYKAIKSALPAVTPSCRCAPGMSSKAQESFNGVWCVDIDGKHNPHIKPDRWGIGRHKLGKLDCCYLSALSAGGKGVFLLLAVDPAQEPKVILEALRRKFAYFGFSIDTSCSNVNRLRFMSYDPEAVAKHPTSAFKADCEPTDMRMGKSNRRNAEARQNAHKWVFCGDSSDRASAAVKIWCDRRIPLDP